jgi:hypothetical protein
MKNPSKTNFKLNKLKLISGGGLSVEYTLQEVIGADTYQSKQKQDSTKQAHLDLEENLIALAPMVAQVFCFTNARDIVMSPVFKADILQKESVAKYVDFIHEKIRITGIAVSGEEGKRGVVITASFAVDNNQRVAINTPRILLVSESRGFEAKLIAIVDSLESEAYDFIYNSKVANPEIFNYSGEDEVFAEEWKDEKEGEKEEIIFKNLYARTN